MAVADMQRFGDPVRGKALGQICFDIILYLAQIAVGFFCSVLYFAMMLPQDRVDLKNAGAHFQRPGGCIAEKQLRSVGEQPCKCCIGAAQQCGCAPEGQQIPDAAVRVMGRVDHGFCVAK